MKKIGLLTFVILMLSALVVNAEATVTDKTVDISNSIITINGVSTEPSQTMTVQIFNSDKELAEILTTGDAENYAAYVGQSVADENGNFTISFTYTGSADKETLNGYIVYGNTTQPEHFSVEFTKFSYYETLIGNLNTAANADNSTDFYNLCNNNKEALCPDLALAGAIDFQKATENFCREVKTNNLDPSDSVTNEKRFMNFIVAQGFNENKISAISGIVDKLNLPESLIDDVKKVAEDTNADNRIAQLMSNKAITTTQSLENELKKSMILAAVQYPDGFANLKDLCEKYASFIGISGKNYASSVYKAVSGSALLSMQELADELAKKAGTVNQSPLGNDGGVGPNFSIVGDTPATEIIGDVHMPFVDLSATSWAYKAVSVLSDKGIINGKTETEFYPNDYVTREEFVKMLVGAMGVKTENNAYGKFTDVDKNMWYAPYVWTGYKNGVCNGISETEFGVGDNIIRQDAAVMVYNVITDKSSGLSITFDDADAISDYAKPAVNKLSSMQIINGKGNNRFEPMSLLTRAEAAQIIYKSFFNY